jgi:hypothetical protein
MTCHGPSIFCNNRVYDFRPTVFTIMQQGDFIWNIFIKDTMRMYSSPCWDEYVHNDLQTETGQIHFVLLKLCYGSQSVNLGNINMIQHNVITMLMHVS